MMCFLQFINYHPQLLFLFGILCNIKKMKQIPPQKQSNLNLEDYWVPICINSISHLGENTGRGVCVNHLIRVPLPIQFISIPRMCVRLCVSQALMCFVMCRHVISSQALGDGWGTESRLCRNDRNAPASTSRKYTHKHAYAQLVHGRGCSFQCNGNVTSNPIRDCDRQRREWSNTEL